MLNPNDYYIKVVDYASGDLELVGVQAYNKSDDSPVDGAFITMKVQKFVTGNKANILLQTISTRALAIVEYADRKFYAGNTIQEGLQQLMSACYNTFWLSSDHADVDNREGVDPGGNYVRAYLGYFDDPDYLAPDAYIKAHASAFITWMDGLTAPELTALYGD